MSQKRLRLTTATGALTGVKTGETDTRCLIRVIPMEASFVIRKRWDKNSDTQTQRERQQQRQKDKDKDREDGYQMPDKGHSNGSKFCDQEKVG